MKKAHSSGNELQTKAMMREIRALRREVGARYGAPLQNRLDRAVALEDREIGLSSSIQNPKSKMNEGGP